MNSIQVLVGLGNPGDQYAKTRHNAGVWLIEKLAARFGVALLEEKKFFGKLARFSFQGSECRLFVPTTYMNLSGGAVASIAQFYKIAPESILIIHDELDFEPGVVRLKFDGGHGGHNGLRDIISAIGSNFWRLRLGIGHPGHRDEVSDYVLHAPSHSDRALIDEAIDRALLQVDDILSGQIKKTMEVLNR